jgi:uncharacterized protein
LTGANALGSGEGFGAPARITSLLIKPVSALCNLDCAYCFYLDRVSDPYSNLPARLMTTEVLERLVDTYLFYSYPSSSFAFQGGEPTLAGAGFFEKLVELQHRFGRAGHNISNSLQTNGVLIDERWCKLFREYNWLVGVSMDGPEEMHDAYRLNRGGQGTWKQVLAAIELMQRESVEFNVLCVLSQANVDKPRDLYRFFRKLGVAHIQYIPLAEFDGHGNPLPYTITAGQYGRFLCETFDAWWPDRRNVRIRFFDNLAEALAGQEPGNCSLREACDSYAVVEYNGDVYPCDFFVESGWKLGNIILNSWPEIARLQRRFSFASKKALARPECEACDWLAVCRRGCPKMRHAPNGRFEDLDFFCAAYKMVYSKCLGPLKRDVDKLLARSRATR